MGVATWPQRYRLQQCEQRSVGGSMAWGTATGIDDQATDETGLPGRHYCLPADRYFVYEYEYCTLCT